MNRTNFYFAMLIVFIAGAGAMWLIIRLATTNTLSDTVGGSEAKYAPLQNSILNQ